MLKNTIHIGTSAISVMFFGRQKNCRKKEKKNTPCNRYATLNTLVLLTLSFSLEKHIFFYSISLQSILFGYRDTFGRKRELSRAR